MERGKKQIYGQDEGIPDRLIENNKINIGSQKVADTLNRYYVTKVRKIQENMKEAKSDPMISYKRNVTSPKQKLKIKEINMKELRDIYRKVNKSNSISEDGISMKTLVKLKVSTQPIILHLINTIIRKGNFPNRLKISRIIPIKKNGSSNKLDPATYRPVNIISPISKIIEKVWAIQINKFLKLNKTIDMNHQGGIKGRSSATITNELFQKLNIIKKNKETGALITLDQSAAFDVIPHKILEMK